MRHFSSIPFALPIAALLLAGSTPAMATGSALVIPIKADLVGFNEVPSVFSEASGRFVGSIDASSIEFVLSYEGLRNVAQAHIHLGQRHTNGGVVVFLCTNLAPPQGVPLPQRCPATAGEVSGVIMADNVGAVAAQGMDAGDFQAIVEAILAGAAYVNVHTEAFPSGELRGQIKVARELAGG